MDKGYSSASPNSEIVAYSPGSGQGYAPAIIASNEPQSQAVVVNQSQPQTVVVVGGQTFNSDPTVLVCPFCKNTVTTEVQKSCSCGAVCLCIMTGLILYLCIQCCRKKDLCCCNATHICPSCKQTVGSYYAC